MIERVRGVLVVCEAGNLVVEVGGVGLAIEVSARAAEDLQGALGQEVRLLTQLVIAGGQDPHPRLFGFRTPEARSLFLLLRGVSGIGPSHALRILAAQESAAEVAAAIAQGNAKGIKVKGVGPKLAKRVISELREKVSGLLGSGAYSRPRPAAAALPQDRELHQAFLALCSLEVEPNRARELLDRIRSEDPEAGADRLIKEALARA